MVWLLPGESTLCVGVGDEWYRVQYNTHTIIHRILGPFLFLLCLLEVIAPNHVDLGVALGSMWVFLEEVPLVALP